jgi:hypothetical protein
MRTNPWVDYVLADEALTRGLGDAEARVLIEWLVDKAEQLVRAGPVAGEQAARRLCRRGRSLGRFVTLWGRRRTRGAALQLAAAERFAFPLPDGPIEPCLLMEHILAWEDQQPAQGRAA